MVTKLLHYRVLTTEKSKHLAYKVQTFSYVYVMSGTIFSIMHTSKSRREEISLILTSVLIKKFPNTCY